MRLKLILKVTVLDHKVKTSSTFLVTENEGLDSPTGFSVFSNWFYAFYTNKIYVTHVAKRSRLRLTYLQMTHLWSSYLSNFSYSHLSYMVQQVTDVCSFLGKI